MLPTLCLQIWLFPKVVPVPLKEAWTIQIELALILDYYYVLIFNFPSGMHFGRLHAILLVFVKEDGKQAR